MWIVSEPLSSVEHFFKSHLDTFKVTKHIEYSNIYHLDCLCFFYTLETRVRKNMNGYIYTSTDHYLCLYPSKCMCVCIHLSTICLWLLTHSSNSNPEFITEFILAARLFLSVNLSSNKSIWISLPTIYLLVFSVTEYTWCSFKYMTHITAKPKFTNQSNMFVHRPFLPLPWSCCEVL